MSTRKNGFPTKLYPVITEFNYVLAKVVINNKPYFLDATVKDLPFGMLPFRCLNKYGRVMDFKNGSYWEDIIPIDNSSKKIQMFLEYTDDNTFEGDLRIVRKGYNSLSVRKKINETSEEKYLLNIEDQSEGIEIISYSNENVDVIEKPLREEFEIAIETDDSVADYIYMNPFFIDPVTENPFKLEERLYPVDFGYPRYFEFVLTMEIPDGYAIESLPKGKMMTLPNDGGKFIYQINHTEYNIRLNFKYSLEKAYFYSQEYKNLKLLFKHMILSQNEPIVLKKSTTVD